MITNGKEIALIWYEKLKEEIKLLDKKPWLAVILVGDNPASIRYVSQKAKWAKEVWIQFKLIKREREIQEEELKEDIKKLNNDETIHGIIIQLPLPSHIDTNTIINTIHPVKDIDGFTAINMGKIALWDESGLAPCTPSGVIHICKVNSIDLEWKNITIIGRSNIVGKPLVSMCINEWATVTCCNSKTKDLKSHTQNADIVVLATGKPWILTKDMIKKDAFVIDVGFTVIDEKIYWDACFQEISENGNPITPVPWWVGRLTVLFIMKNTLKAFYMQNK